MLIDKSDATARAGTNYPIVIGAGFIVLSLVLYWARFPEARDGFVVVYVLTCVLALVLGSFTGCRAKLRSHAPTAFKSSWLWVACLLLCLTATVNISVYYSSLSEIGGFVFEPGAAYERVKFLNRTGDAGAGLVGGAFGPLISMLAFTKFVVFGWSTFYWGSLSKRLRVVCLTSMAYYALQALLIGAMVNVGTVLISTMAILLVRSNDNLKASGMRLLRSAILPAVLGAITLAYFLGSRQAQAVSFWERVTAGADGLVYYISNGYVGLGYALALPFESTGGRTILYGFTRIGNGTLPLNSYPVRTEAATGWSATQVWSTAAPWLASDITFWGVVALLLAVGVWAGRLWMHCRVTPDPFGMLLIGQFAVGVFFFPANNYLLQTFPNASGFIIIILGYLVNRKISSRRFRSNEAPAKVDYSRDAL